MKLKIALAAALIATPAFAQQPPQQDPALALLNEANGRVVEIARQLNAANADLVPFSDGSTFLDGSMFSYETTDPAPPTERVPSVEADLR